jgi:hypothetical protein
MPSDRPEQTPAFCAEAVPTHDGCLSEQGLRRHAIIQRIVTAYEKAMSTTNVRLTAELFKPYAE